MNTYRALRLLRADRRGSSLPVLIDTAAGVFHTKLRGAAQAPASLVAEIIVGELADALGLQVPARALINVPPALPVEESTYGLAELLNRSTGLNLGFQLLANARNFVPRDAPQVDEELASSIVWLDGLVQNPDRIAKNPNLLWSQKQLFLIDHGASLGFQHNWPRVTEASPRKLSSQATAHVLHLRATRLRHLDASLAARLDRATLEAAADAVPDEFLEGDTDAKRRRRAAFVAFLWKRLKSPRPFVAQPLMDSATLLMPPEP